MAKIYEFPKDKMKEEMTLGELHEALAPDMPIEDFIQIAVNANFIHEDGTPTQWAIDNGYINPPEIDEETLQLMEISVLFGVSREDLLQLIENNELVWLEDENEWSFSKQGIEDIGILSSKKEVREMSKRFILSKAM